MKLTHKKSSSRNINSLIRIFESALYYKIVLTIFIFLAVFALTLTGFGWDAPFHTYTAGLIVKMKSNLSLQQAYEQIPFLDETYGILIQALGALLELGIAGKNLNEITSTSVETYYWQGLVNIVFMTLAVYSISKAIVKLLPDYNEKLVLYATQAFLWTTPLWFGYANTNFKDLPVASGLLISAAAQMNILITIGSKRKIKKSNRVLKSPFAYSRFWIENLILNILGVILIAGTRISTFIIILLSHITFLLLLMVTRIKFANYKFSSFLKYEVSYSFYLFGFLYLALYILHPLARIDFFQWVTDAYNISKKFPWDGDILTNGMLLRSTSLPYWYIPIWTAVSISISLIVCICVVSLSTKKIYKSLDLNFVIYVFPLILLAILVPIAMSIQRIVLYDGIRHVAFALLPFVTLIWVLFLKVLKILKLKNHYVVLMIFTLVTFQSAESIAWYPYSYTHKNLLIDRNLAISNWEYDYWGATTREGINRLRRDYGLTEVAILPSGEMATMFDGTWFGTIDGSDIVLAAGKNMPDVLGVYQFDRYTWSQSADFPLNDCKDVPLAPCKNMPSFKCKVLFTISREGHRLGRGAACLNPAKNLDVSMLELERSRKN